MMIFVISSPVGLFLMRFLWIFLCYLGNITIIFVFVISHYFTFSFLFNCFFVLVPSLLLWRDFFFLIFFCMSSLFCSTSLYDFFLLVRLTCCFLSFSRFILVRICLSCITLFFRLRTRIDRSNPSVFTLIKIVLEFSFSHAFLQVSNSKDIVRQEFWDNWTCK